MKTPYTLLGQYIFTLGRPILRLMLRQTQRVYVVIRSAECILLVRNWIGNGKWALPGGGVSSGETNTNAAIRELKEELRVQVKSSELDFVCDDTWQTHGFNFRFSVFTIEVPQFKVQRNKLELVQAEWIDIDALDKSMCDLEVWRVLTLIYK